jgi:arginase
MFAVLDSSFSRHPASRKLELIEAPSSLGLRPPAPGKTPGTRRMPHALLEAGLIDGVTLTGHVVLNEPQYSFVPDAQTGVRNFSELVRFTRELQQVVTAALAADRLPVILGGDCSVLLGPAVALKQRGRFSLVHLDGHNDFAHEGNTGHNYPNVAGADLAVVTGRGPAALADFDGLKPYFRDEDVIQLGEKAQVDAENYSLKDFPLTLIRRFPLDAVRSDGLVTVLERISVLLAQAPTQGWWLHVDLDVLDASLLPAVDSPDGPGFTWTDLDTVLSVLLRQPRLMGLNIGIYDPDLDPTREYAMRIAELLRQHLRFLSQGTLP